LRQVAKIGVGRRVRSPAVVEGPHPALALNGSGENESKAGDRGLLPYQKAFLISIKYASNVQNDEEVGK